MRLTDRQIDALVAVQITKLHGVEPESATYLDRMARPDLAIRPVPSYTAELEDLAPVRASLAREGYLLVFLEDDGDGGVTTAAVRDAAGRIVHAARDERAARAACIAALMAVRKRRRAFEIPLVEA